MPRVLLLVPSFTYRAPDFVAAASRVGAEVVVGSDRRQALAGPMGDRAVVVDMVNHDAGVAAIVALHERAPVNAIVAVDDAGVVVAAEAARRLGLLHNPPDAVRRTRDKAAMRAALAASGDVRQPDFVVVEPGAPATAPWFPCVVKATGLSASRGVIRADDPAALAAAASRVRRIVGDDSAALVVERYVPGREVAVEGLLDGGALHVLAVFDKPDPLEGPYFEETIYVTPSRLPPAILDAVEEIVARACAAIGLVEGPIHAEARIDNRDEPWLLEVAARSIGGLCARTLRFGAGIALEELIVRHALRLPLDDVERERAAAGVMMLPVPSAGLLQRVDGRAEAAAVEGIAGLEITVPLGRPVTPLPEGDRYLGFLFGRGETPADVERALREAAGRLSVVIDGEGA